MRHFIPHFLFAIGLIYCISIANPVLGQEQEQSFTIYSKYLQEERSFWVSLPKHYDVQQYACHALYVFDADEQQSSQTYKAIRNQLFEVGQYIRPLIIIGIEQKNRSRELQPHQKKGKQFSNFVEKEVVPFIDSVYNTIPDRIIAGHSLGGYFALNTWMQSELFRACFAFSPAIYCDDNRIRSDLDNYFKNKRPKGLLYVNHGTEGRTESEIQKYIPAFNKVLNQNKNDSLLYQYKVYQNYGHNYTPIVGLTDALLFHFSQWQLDNTTLEKLWDKTLPPIPTFHQLYEQLDHYAGFKVEREADLLYNLALHYHETGDSSKAIELVNYAIELNPKDGFAYLNKAEILLKSNPEEAKENLIQALLYLKPEDVFEGTKNFKEYDFWRSVIQEYLLEIEQATAPK